ncbi:GNAT family N-acetyltransferase [Burkholderia sp. ABCPW 14]|uniref:GNAT family N-acetyltransferase n=1 Tax=Burkholderia sp. ABCPW 14 TaxID=1637860 RepID=UPI001E472479|nr:N-acetyltransferase [Burkholderia sp. ABCPW 14]
MAGSRRGGPRTDQPGSDDRRRRRHQKWGGPRSARASPRIHYTRQEYGMFIREEPPRDFDAIRAIVGDAFRGRNPRNEAGHVPREHLMIDALRKGDALTLGLVAVDDDTIVGHVVISLALIGGKRLDWHGLAPLAVRPDRQNAGVGGALVREGLDRLRLLGAQGCVVLGYPGYYGRFGFAARAALSLDSVPPEYFSARSFTTDLPGAPSRSTRRYPMNPDRPARSSYGDCRTTPIRNGATTIWR